MAATFYKSDSIPASVAGVLTYARAVDTIVIDSNGMAWRSTSASTASYVPLGVGTLEVATAASSGHTGTVAETVFSTGTYTIPADLLSAGVSGHLQVSGLCTNAVEGTALTLRVRIGGVAGTALCVSMTQNMTTNDVFSMDCRFTVRTAGATGTVIGSGTGFIGPASTPMGGFSYNGTSTAIDTTATQALVCTAQWTVADASSVRLDQFVLTLG